MYNYLDYRFKNYTDIHSSTLLCHDKYCVVNFVRTSLGRPVSHQYEKRVLSRKANSIYKPSRLIEQEYEKQAITQRELIKKNHAVGVFDVDRKILRHTK